MANANRNQLQQAYTLIEQDRLEEAVTILQGIITLQPNNEAAWWLMANALSEPVEAADALQNVLRINPNHAEAQAGLRQLLAEYPELAAPAPTQAAPLDDFDFNFDEDTPGFDPTPPPGSAARPAPQGDFDFNLDALLANTPAGTKPSANAAAPDWLSADSGAESGNDLDLDSLFGSGSAFGLPTTASEDAELSAMFDAGLEDAPRPKSTAALPTQAEPAAPSMDDLFGGFDFGDQAAQPAQTGTGQLPGDDFFASLGQAASGGASAQAAAPGMDDLFGGFDFGGQAGQPTQATPAGTGPLPGDDFFASLDQTSSSAGDTDDLFGGMDFTQPPATRPNDATLNLTQAGIDDLFGTPAPSRPAPQPKPASEPVIPAQNLDMGGLDDLFGGPGSAQAARGYDEPEPMAAEVGAQADLGNLDDLLGQYERAPEPNRDYTALPNMEGDTVDQQDIDSFFQATVGGEFAGTPGFVDQIEEGKQPKKERGRRRRDKGGAAAAAAAGFPTGPSPETMAEMAVEQPAKPARRERAPKPAPAPVVAVYDPYVLEAKANRRSPVRVVLLGLVMLVALMGLGLVASRLLAPDALTQAALNIQNQLTGAGLESVNASITDKNIGVRFCTSNVRREMERRVFTAMDVIANNAAPVRESLETANLRVVSCANPDRVLYAASTTLTEVIRYTETGDRRAYRQSWR